MTEDLMTLLIALLVIGTGAGIMARRSSKAIGARKKVDRLSEKTEEAPSSKEESETGPSDSSDDESKALRQAALNEGLAKTRKGGFVAKISSLFQGKKIDASILESLEEVLFTADIGVKTSQKIFERLKKQLSSSELTDADAVWMSIREISREILSTENKELNLEQGSPTVIFMIGVNGVGKTTTIGKLAAKYTAMGKRVMLAAGDTFRAAAVEQLEIWGERTGCPVVSGKEGQDPSSVIFSAIEKAQEEKYDILLADTAGRLHTKSDLMDELKKIGRVADKAMSGAPHETFLVVDSTTGQNAIAQAQLFREAMNFTGVVLTKLDGTAKGGVILGICDEMRIPVRYIGIGEQVDDLREFYPEEFIAALYGSDVADKAA